MAGSLGSVCLLVVLVSQAWAQTIWYTYSGDQCTFPFTYKGVQYNACTRVDNFKDWCGILPEVPDRIPLPGTWGYCYGTSPPDELPFITPKYGDCVNTIFTTNNQQCSIPFTYNGQEYNRCITTNVGMPWCSLDRTYDAYSGRWGICDLSDCPVTPGPDDTCNIQTVQGNPCYFPFTYKNVQYNTCINLNADDYWCSTTPTYNGLIGNCALNFTTSGERCVFPFVYQGQLYQGCTSVGHTGGAPWCSLDTVYKGNWGTCNMCP